LILVHLGWLLSEERMAYYVKTLRESLWENGKWTDADPILTKAQAAERRKNLKILLDDLFGILASMLLKSKANVLNEEPLKLVLDKGTDDAANMIIDIAQSKTRNKHIIFALMELGLGAIFPEIVKERAASRVDALPYLHTLSRVDAVGSLYTSGR